MEKLIQVYLYQRMVVILDAVMERRVAGVRGESLMEVSDGH